VTPVVAGIIELLLLADTPALGRDNDSNASSASNASGCRSGYQLYWYAYNTTITVTSAVGSFNSCITEHIGLLAVPGGHSSAAASAAACQFLPLPQVGPHGRWEALFPQQQQQQQQVEHKEKEKEKTGRNVVWQAGHSGLPLHLVRKPSHLFFCMSYVIVLTLPVVLCVVSWVTALHVCSSCERGIVAMAVTMVVTVSDPLLHRRPRRHGRRCQ
jgi:hypothetical protein